MDENYAYDVDLFRKMCLIQPAQIGVWPVGLSNGLMIRTPLLPLNEQHPIAGLAMSVDLLFNQPNPPTFNDLLTHLLKQSNVQVLGKNNSSVLVWQVKTEIPFVINRVLEQFFGRNKF
jgi:hypothetical protein